MIIVNQRTFECRGGILGENEGRWEVGPLTFQTKVTPTLEWQTRPENG